VKGSGPMFLALNAYFGAILVNVIGVLIFDEKITKK